jgi:hypothetical protein
VRDDGRRIVVVRSQSAEAEKTSVLLGQFLEILAHLKLGHRIRKVKLLTVDDILRHIGVEILQGSYSDSVQHLANIIFRMRKI